MDRVPRKEDTQRLKITTTFREFLLSDGVPPGIRSNEDTHRLTLTNYFGKFLLSDDDNSRTAVVIEFGTVTRFVSYLARVDFPELQYQAAWALANIASGTSENTKVVVDHGAVPIFIQLLSSPNTDVCEQATWALGNIAGESPENRDLVLANGALIPLLSLMNEQQPDSPVLKAGTWALSNFCRGQPYPPFDEVKLALPVLAYMIYLDDESILKNACWALSYLSDGNNDIVQAVCDEKVCPRLIELLLHPSHYVLFPALRTVGNIVNGGGNHIQMLIDNEALPCLHILLTKKNVYSIIKRDVCLQISKITGYKDHIEAVIRADFVGPLVHLLLTAKLEKEEAGRAVSNLMVHGSHDVIKNLVDNNDGVIRAFRDLLEDPDIKTVLASLIAMEKIMDAGEVEKYEGLPGGVNRYLVEFSDLEGLDIIERLNTHQDAEIRKKAESVMEYFAYQEIRQNRGV